MSRSPDDGEISSGTGGHDLELREQDKWLPIANVSRIMKTSLPDKAKVSKEAKECVQECVSEFVSFITSEASERCLAEKRKTVNGEDVLFALTSLGFENYSEVLKIYLAKYREFQATKQERGGGAQERRKSRATGGDDVTGSDSNGNQDYDPTQDPIYPKQEDEKEKNGDVQDAVAATAAAAFSDYKGASIPGEQRQPSSLNEDRDEVDIYEQYSGQYTNVNEINQF